MSELLEIDKHRFFDPMGPVLTSSNSIPGLQISNVRHRLSTVHTLAVEDDGGPAQVEKAERFRQAMLFNRKDEDGKITPYEIWSTKLSNLPQINGGILSFMHSQTYFGVVFLIMGVLKLPDMVLYSLGDAYQKSFFTALDMLSLGNLGTLANLDPGKSQDVQGVSRSDIGLYCSFMDFVISGYLFYMIHAFSWDQNKNLEEKKGHATTTRDFSVKVTNIPEIVLEPEDFIDYFSEFGNRSYTPITHIFNYTISVHIQGQRTKKPSGLVVDVAILYNRSRLVALHVKRRELKSRKIGKLGQLGDELMKLVKLQKDELAQVEKEIAEIRADEASKRPVVAYVTFSTINERNACINSHFYSNFLGGGNRFFFDNVLRVEAAPHPSDINFEGLDVTDTIRGRNRTFGFWMVVIIIIGSFVSVVYLKSFQAGLPSQGECEPKYEQYIRTSNATQTEIDCYCDSLSYQRMIDERHISVYTKKSRDKKTQERKGREEGGD
eukprot:jgi/Bigna1/71576/fgenesh1_pg.16_\